MKICTVTFQAAINYGAVLQTYALQRVFKDMGHECDVLNYECPAIKKADISFDKAYIKNIKNLNISGGNNMFKQKVLAVLTSAVLVGSLAVG
ncbi:MAG: hypothetical protein RSA27_05680, partial [Oscillospiraceae bacterium]